SSVIAIGLERVADGMTVCPVAEADPAAAQRRTAARGKERVGSAAGAGSSPRETPLPVRVPPLPCRLCRRPVYASARGGWASASHEDSVNAAQHLRVRLPGHLLPWGRPATRLQIGLGFSRAACARAARGAPARGGRPSGGASRGGPLARAPRRARAPAAAA